jgi:hypothetical protein
MMLTPYAGMVPSYYFESPIRFHDYDDAENVLMWPASNVSAFEELAALPPYSIWSQGNPTGTPPQCTQTLPMTTNWSGAYVPNTTADVLESWMENNPVEAMVIGLAMLAAGAALSRAL